MEAAIEGTVFHETVVETESLNKDLIS